MAHHDIRKIQYSKIYPAYVNKALRKGKTKEEVDTIIQWLTGYSLAEMNALEQTTVDLEKFIEEAPRLNPNRLLVKGTICGVRVEEIEDPIVRFVRILDKMIDELANGKSMEKILRT